MNSIRKYLRELAQPFRAGVATEHTYRPALKNLLAQLMPGVHAANEPKHIACGAPDFVLTRNNIPLGYIEAKDIGTNLNALDARSKAQLQRYREALGNLVLTDYLDFRLFREGQPAAAVRIAKVEGKAKAAPRRITPLPENFAAFANLINGFTAYQGQTILTVDELAKGLAQKTRLLAAVIAQVLEQDEDAGRARESAPEGELQQHLAAFRKHLLRGISIREFAGVYAQTIAYGMFAARLHDSAPQTFSRQKAAELVPGSNPFLQALFRQLAGYGIDKRMLWIVDDLVDIFRAADLSGLMKGFGKSTQRSDPFMHFYETFLAEYDPKQRKSRGVYYTPEPAVSFIVRAVDEILQREFKLPEGLAHTGKTRVPVEMPGTGNGKTKMQTQTMHKLQILDPGVGTGTFLASIVKHIHENRFAGQQGAWPSYAREELIPRLNGFEILMAPYTMAHTKLEMVLNATGCELNGGRMQIFLTNSLEEHFPAMETMIGNWLAAEANQASRIKKETPVMVVIGNPPYAVSSSNRGPWIQELITPYKEGLHEKKLNLDDDYIKFIRYGEHLVQRTGEGVLAYISNNSFLDGLTHRQMRKKLLDTFDKIYILDLHGNARKKERAPDGSADGNVFDIMQGVSINLFVKTGGANKKPARVFHCDLYGRRETKYAFLRERKLRQVGYQKLAPKAPYYFFTPKDFSAQGEYQKGISLRELFPAYGSGVITRCDELAVQFTRKALQNVVNNFERLGVSDLKLEYAKEESVNWTFAAAKKDIMSGAYEFTETLYRPFDLRHTLLTRKSAGFISRPGYAIMQHMQAGENCMLIFARQFHGRNYNHIFVANTVFDGGTMTGWGYGAPLYLYPEAQRELNGAQKRKPNLNPELVQRIAAGLGLPFSTEKQKGRKSFAPVDLLDYIYAVLHAPAYRARYLEFLKIDFPRVPVPEDRTMFWRLVKQGGELRALHLLESPKLQKPVTTYPQADGHAVSRVEFKITDAKKRLGKVHINNKQYFGAVPEAAWNAHVGGYQPAQKWLKDRRGRKLSAAEINHYQKIITALSETQKITRAITPPGFSPQPQTPRRNR